MGGRKSTDAAEDSIDLVDQINGDIAFLKETLKLMGAASHDREK